MGQFLGGLVQYLVGHGIIHLAPVAHAGGYRGKKDKVFEAAGRHRLQQGPGPGHLGIKDPVHLLPGLVGDKPINQDAGTVNQAGNFAERLPDPAEHPGHGRRVPDIHGIIGHLPADGAEIIHGGRNLPGGPVPLKRFFQVRRGDLQAGKLIFHDPFFHVCLGNHVRQPGRFRFRQGRTAQQNKSGSAGPGQGPGALGGYAAGAAGHDHHVIRPQVQRPCRAGSFGQGHGLPGSGVQADFQGTAGICQFRGHGRGRRGRVCPVRRYIDAAADDVFPFNGRRLDGAVQGSRHRVETSAAGQAQAAVQAGDRRQQPVFSRCAGSGQCGGCPDDQVEQILDGGFIFGCPLPFPAIRQFRHQDQPAQGGQVFIRRRRLGPPLGQQTGLGQGLRDCRSQVAAAAADQDPLIVFQLQARAGQWRRRRQAKGSAWYFLFDRGRTRFG